MELVLAPEEMTDALATAMRRALDEAGIVKRLQEALELQLALRGLLDKPAAAKFLGIETRTLEVWMRPAGENGGRGVPHFKIGEAVRFRLAALEAWVGQFEVNKLLPKAA